MTQAVDSPRAFAKQTFLLLANFFFRRNYDAMQKGDVVIFEYEQTFFPLEKEIRV